MQTLVSSLAMAGTLAGLALIGLNCFPAGVLALGISLGTLLCLGAVRISP